MAANMVMHEGNEEGPANGFLNYVILGLQQLSYQIQP